MRISDWSSDVCSSDLLKSKQPLPFGEQEKKPAPPAADEDLAEELEIDEDADNVEEDVDSGGDDDQIGRASRRERVCQYVQIWGVAVSFKNNTTSIFRYWTLRSYKKHHN